MTAERDLELVARFRSVVAARLGLAFDESRLGFLHEVLRSRSSAQDVTPEAYVERVEGRLDRQELGAVAQALTVPETYFFRNPQQFEALREVALPAALARSPARPARISVLSAGCATGEEPYSLAIVLREALADPSAELLIFGLDISSAALERARRGRFSAWSLRETAPARRARWFRESGREFELDAEIRAAVRFAHANLAANEPQLLGRAAHDVVFCRNVLMYFTPDKCREVVRRLGECLVPGGYLFLGHAETLRGLSHDFELCHSHDAFYYRLKGGESRVPAGAPRSEFESTEEPGVDWVAAIARATTRIEALARQPESAAGLSESAEPARHDLTPALELLRREQFGGALGVVQGMSQGQAGDPDVLLLECVLLAQRGEILAAEQACQRLLAVDALNAGAHYVLGLCSEGTDSARAVHHYQVASYLDPSFAMPHLRLGLSWRRARNWPSARQELERARTLLEREEPARLLMFGGGFGRAALLALCSTEVEAQGERQ